MNRNHILVLSIGVNIFIFCWFIWTYSKRFIQEPSNVPLKEFRDDYKHRVSHFESLPNDSAEIVFLGNSIIDGAEWSELFKNPNIKNRGISGDFSLGILNRINEVTSSNPQKIFLMIGTNDIARGFSTGEIIQNINGILDSIEVKSPKTIVYIHSVLPVGRVRSKERPINKIIELNKELKALCHIRNKVFINLFPIFSDKENYLSDHLSIDGLHLNGKGYSLWSKHIRSNVLE